VNLRLLRPFFICIALLISLAGHADEVAIPPLVHRVTDLTGSLSQGQQAALEAKLAAFEQQKGSQIAVLIVPSTKPEEIDQYSIRVVEAWKIGRDKVDDGVLVLVAKDDRKMRIEVGYGLEGAIPDAYAKRIIADVIAPYFKQGDIYGGLDAGVDKIIGLIGGEQLPPAAEKSSGSSSGNIEHLLPLLIFGGLITAIFFRSMFGRLFGGVANGGLIAGIVWLITATLGIAIVFGVIAFVFTLMAGSNSRGGFGGMPGGFGGGGFGGGSDTFSGGGGDFGGGGASGDW